MGKNVSNITKDSIVNAAKQVFTKYGYKKTTLEDITSALDIGKTAVYYYFTNKKEVFSAVLEKEAENMEKELTKIVEKNISPKLKFENYINTRMKFHKNLSNYYTALRHDISEQYNFINKTRQSLDEIEISTIKAILDEGVNKNVFVPLNTEEIGETIILTLKSLELPLFGSEGPRNKEKTLKRISYLLLNGISV